MIRSFPFDAELVGGEWDRVYLAEDFARYFATFIGNGVFPNPATGLQIIAIDNNMQVRIKQGLGWINGRIFENTDDYILKLDVADGALNRIDRVTLRLDFLTRDIIPVIKKGDYATNAVAKTLQRDADAYEIALADIKINKGVIKITQADITDLRLNKNLCGIVHGVVDQVDTTAIFNQFQSWYNQTKTNYDKDVATWTQEKKQAFDAWYNTNTQTFLSQFNDWYGGNTSKWASDFNNWFNNIKGQLDGDIAGKLQNQINDINDKIKDISKNEYATMSVKDYVTKLPDAVDGYLDVELEGNTVQNLNDLADIKHLDSCCVKSVGKNLFNGVYKKVYTDGSEPHAITIGENTRTAFVEISKGKTYTIKKHTSSNRMILGLYNSTEVGSIPLKPLQEENGTTVEAIITNDVGAKYLSVYVSNNNETPKMQVEEGSVATEYEEYREDKIDILSQLQGDKSLKRLQNGVADGISCNGVLTRRIGKVTLNGSENWSFAVTRDTTLVFTLEIVGKTKGDINMLCDRFKVMPQFTANIENVNGRNDSNTIAIEILKSRLSTPDLVRFKEWLKSNPTTVYYELAEPVIEKFTQPLNLQSFKNGHLIIDTPIPPIGRIKYPVNIGGAVSSLANAVNNVENRTTKLEQGLFVTTATAISNTEKILNLTSNGKISGFTLTNVIPINPNEFAPGEIKLIVK